MLLQTPVRLVTLVPDAYSLCFHFICLRSSLPMVVTGECWIPGVIGYLDTKASSRLIVVYSLVVVAEFGSYYLGAAASVSLN
jgi:hypothetical protein